MKKRILYLLPSLATGGLERMVYLLSMNLDRTQFSPEVQVFDRVGVFAQATRESGIPVRFDPRGPGFFDPRFLGALVRRLRNDPPDVIHAHNVTSLVYGTLAAKLSGGIPVVYTEHDRAFPGPLHDRAMNLAAGRMVDRFCVVADWIKKSLVRYEKLPASRIEVVPNGIEGSAFRRPIDPGPVRAALGIPEGAPVAGCVARLAHVKNHRGLLIAWRRIVDIWPNATLLTIGEGPDLEDLQALASRLELGRAVRFLGNRSDVPELYAAMDFHVLASHSEGMSLTLLEAMASSRASVATDVGGNREVLEDGRTGLLVSAAGDGIQRLAAAMAFLIQDRETTRKLGEAAAVEFERRFNLEVMVQAYQRIYRECRPLPHRAAGVRGGPGGSANARTSRSARSIARWTRSRA